MPLKLIDSKKENRRIDQTYSYTLNADKAGIYFIEITANAKSHGQNHSFYKQADDEMSVQINGLDQFTQINAARWNGNELKNLQKTVVLLPT